VVLYSRRELAKYKRRAQVKYPVEYIGLLFGTVTAAQVTIEKFVTVPQRGTRYYVNWLDVEGAQNIIAETEASSGLEFICTIHSHTLTHCEAHVPSAKDNDEAYVWEERVFALDHIRKKNGRFSHSIAFYKPQQPLEDVAGF